MVNTEHGADEIDIIDHLLGGGCACGYCDGSEG